MALKIHTLKLDLGMKLMTELSKIDRFDASWATIEKRESASLKQLKSIATVRSVGASTRIEGSRMTDDEVAVLIEKLSISKLKERDQQEVIGYFENNFLIAYSCHIFYPDKKEMEIHYIGFDNEKMTFLYNWHKL